MSGGLKFLIAMLVIITVFAVPALFYFKRKRTSDVLLEQTRQNGSQNQNQMNRQAEFEKKTRIFHNYFFRKFQNF